MTPRHHPHTAILDEFAAGALGLEHHVVIAAHLGQCALCSAHVMRCDAAGGAALEALPPTALPEAAFDRIAACLDFPEAPPQHGDALVLPQVARPLPAGPWRRISARLEMRRIDVGFGLTGRDDGARLLLLRGRPGAKLLRHSHAGREMTCVLSGSFCDGDQCFKAGDFNLGLPDVAHEIVIGEEGPCISLVALQGKVELRGFMGRLLRPFIKL